MSKHRKCLQCGGEFTPQQGNAGKFCTTRCYHTHRHFDPDRDFWPRVDKSGEHWLWTGPVFKKTGYGMTYIDGKTVSVHRIAYRLIHGDIPDRMQVRHGCDIRLCVLHLSVGTASDNMQDAVQRGRISRGEGRPAAKLTESSVIDIRRRSSQGEKGSELANEYGVSRSVISSITTRKTWKHIV